MKNFTLIIALLIFALIGKAEKSTNLQTKILKLKAKTDQILQHNAFLSKNMAGSKSTNHKIPVYFDITETQKLDSAVYLTYDAENSIWKNDWKDFYVYNAQMKSTLWTEYEWIDETGTWAIWAETKVFYKPNGKIDYLLFYSLDDVSGELFVDTKIEIFLSQEDKLDSTVTYMAESDDSFIKVAIQKYQFNSSGRVIQGETWTMEEDDEGLPTGMIVKSVITKYEYNSSGQLTLMRDSYYIDGEEWPFSQSEYSHNTSGQLTSVVNSGLNFLTFQFEISDKTDYSYNPAGDIDVEIDSDWNSSNETWNETYKYENTYSNESFSDIVFPSYFSLLYGVGDPEFLLFNKVIVSDKSFEKIGETWMETDRTRYYYSGGTTNVNDLNNPSVKFYPNPASKDITLSWNNRNKLLNLQIYQISGVKVLEQNAFSGDKISVSHLQIGIYLVKLLDGKQTVYAGKLIKN